MTPSKRSTKAAVVNCELDSGFNSEEDIVLMNEVAPHSHKENIRDNRSIQKQINQEIEVQEKTAADFFLTAGGIDEPILRKSDQNNSRLSGVYKLAEEQQVMIDTSNKCGQSLFNRNGAGPVHRMKSFDKNPM